MNVQNTQKLNGKHSPVSLHGTDMLFMIDKATKVEHSGSLPELIRRFKKLSWSFVDNPSTPSKRS